jgi:ribosomal 30S subunit maturation factor RimM
MKVGRRVSGVQTRNGLGALRGCFLVRQMATTPASETGVFGVPELHGLEEVRAKQLSK